MNEHQKETAFLRYCIGYDDTAECHNLEESVAIIQRNQRCVRRAVWLMALLAFGAMAGLCYRLVFMVHLQEFPDLSADFITKPLCALGLGSLICLVAFLGLGVHYRRQLNRQREECRRLATRMLESRLGKSRSQFFNDLQGAGKRVESATPPAVIAKLATEALGVGEISFKNPDALGAKGGRH